LTRPICQASASRKHRSARNSSTRWTISAGVIDDFRHTAELDRFAIYVFDYGALVGFRLTVKHPERVTAVISLNGNSW
jgi:pimeloyl-ACP methyl ester carboxylesterase